MKREKKSKEELQVLLDAYSSVGKVAAHLSIPYSTIYSWYKSYDIKLLPSCMTIYEELRSVKFTRTQKSVILGSILGDGSLLKNKCSKNARLQIGHCTKQLGYLEWKKDLLAPFVKRVTLAEKPGPKVICGVDSYSTGYYFINTIAHPDVTEYYDKYYKMGKKRVIEEVIDELDLLALSIWLADDGSFSLQTGSKTGLRGSIATCSFTKKEISMLMVAFRKFYSGHMSISNDGRNVIYLSGTPAISSLLDLVTSVLPECIHYKFVPQRLIRETP